MFSTESLSGNITVLITETDWNQNRCEKYLSLISGGSDIPSLSAAAGNRSITLSRDPIPGAENYTLYYTKDGSYPNFPTGTNGFAISNIQPAHVLDTYNHDGDPGNTDRVKNGEMQVFRLRAQFPSDSGMQDSWSDFVKALPLSRLTLAPKMGKDRTGKIDLWWYDIPAGTGYLIYRAEDKGGSYYQLSDRLQEAKYTDRTVSVGVTYSYKVKPNQHSEVESYPMPGKTSTLYFSARIGGVNLGSAPGAITVDGAFTYMGTYEDGFNIVDVSDPQQPLFEDSGDCNGAVPMSTGGIALKGDYAYIASGQGIKIVDVSDPVSPSLICTFESGRDVSDLFIVNDTLYALGVNKGLFRYRIPDPADPSGMILERIYDEVINGRFVI